MAMVIMAAASRESELEDIRLRQLLDTEVIIDDVAPGRGGGEQLICEPWSLPAGVRAIRTDANGMQPWSESSAEMPDYAATNEDDHTYLESDYDEDNFGSKSAWLRTREIVGGAARTIASRARRSWSSTMEPGCNWSSH